MDSIATFTAHTQQGSGRGTEISIPTLNVQMEEVPSELDEGIYACLVTLSEDAQKLPAVMHYGPRPFFQDTPTCEIHVIDTEVTDPPISLTVDVVEHLREISNFSSLDELKTQISADIDRARAILSTQ